MTTFNLYDAPQQALAFVVNQAYAINQRVYETKYPEYDYGRLVFVDESSPEWSGGILSFVSNTSGAAKWFNPGAKDVPFANVDRSMVEKSFDTAAIGYEFDAAEVGRAGLEGRPLQAQRALAAGRAYNQFMYNLTVRGDSTKGLQGLVNYTGVTSALVPNDGTSSSRLWTAKTPAQIVRDINLALTGVYTGSLETEMADTLLLPIEALLYLEQTPYSSTTMDTIASFVARTNTYTLRTGRPLTMVGVRGLENDGDSSTGRMVAYNNAEDVVRLHLPMRHRFAPVWQDGPYHFVVPGMFRTGGVEIQRPAAFRYYDGFWA